MHNFMILSGGKVAEFMDKTWTAFTDYFIVLDKNMLLKPL